MSNYTKHALTRMKKEELAALAVQELGEFFDEDVTKDQMLEKLIPALVGDDTEPSEQPTTTAAAGSNEPSDPNEEYCWLMLSNDNIDGRASGDQFLSVGNYDVLMTFGKWGKVKRKIVSLLETLIWAKHEAYVDEKTGRLRTRSTESYRFAFQVRTLEQGPGQDMKRSGGLNVGGAH